MYIICVCVSMRMCVYMHCWFKIDWLVEIKKPYFNTHFIIFNTHFIIFSTKLKITHLTLHYNVVT